MNPAQQQQKSQEKLTPRPGPFGDRPGVYSLVTKLISPVINSGDIVSFQLFFSGYGTIEIGKVFLTLPAEIFDSNESKISSDMSFNKAGWQWNANPVKMVDKTETIVITQNGGFQLPSWPKPTQFFNTGDKTTITLSTESVTKNNEGNKRGSGPMNFDLKTIDNIRPGNYGIDIVYTYFNGETWYASPKRVEFKVQNFLERFATPIGVIAAVASVLAIAIGVLELYDRLF